MVGPKKLFKAAVVTEGGQQEQQEDAMDFTDADALPPRDARAGGRGQ
jgi:hypothetical protein